MNEHAHYVNSTSPINTDNLNNKLKDAELSLVVAKIMYPDENWFIDKHGLVLANKDSFMDFFDFNDKKSAFDMAVWISNNTQGVNFVSVLSGNNPGLALAIEIKKLGETNEVFNYYKQS